MAALPTSTLIAIGEELGRALAETENRLDDQVMELRARLITAETTIAELAHRLEAAERRDLREALRPRLVA